MYLSLRSSQIPQKCDHDLTHKSMHNNIIHLQCISVDVDVDQAAAQLREIDYVIINLDRAIRPGPCMRMVHLHDSIYEHVEQARSTSCSPRRIVHGV